ELKQVPALHLRPIECRAGILQQSGGVAAVLRVETDADAARNEDLLVFEKKCLIQSLLDRARHIRSVLRARDLRQQDRKLVATEARDRIALTHTTRETLGH